MPKQAEPILCYVTDRHALPGADLYSLSDIVPRAVAAGVGWIQVREKDLPARALLELTRSCVAAARNAQTRIIVNDRMEVALAAGAAGVHLGARSLPIAIVAEWRRTAGAAAPKGFLIGASCHSLAEALEAERAGGDYVFFGPVFATPSKAAFGSPQGIAKLAEVCRSLLVPVLAIGGITAENAAECLAAGAAGIAAIRLFQEAADLATVAAALRRR